MNYHHLAKQKTLSFGAYPDASHAEARTRCNKARKLSTGGINPNAAKQEAKQATAVAAANTVKLMRRA